MNADHNFQRPLHGANERGILSAELLISNLLRFGVTASFVLVVIGTALSFTRHPEYFSSSQELLRLTRPGAAFPHTLSDVFQGILNFRGQAVVTIGLLLLIATPVMRVAFSIYAFLRQGDRIFTVITMIVFGILMSSLVLGKVE